MAALALFSATLFGAGLMTLDKAIDLRLATPKPNNSTYKAGERLQQLAANTLYTAILTGLGTMLTIMTEVLPEISNYLKLFSLGMVVLVATNVMVVTRRIYGETLENTNSAMSGDQYHQGQDQ